MDWQLIVKLHACIVIVRLLKSFVCLSLPGVVLCPVLSKTGKDPCFLLILDGQTFQEIARAETPADLKMPLTFHGNYVPKAK